MAKLKPVLVKVSHAFLLSMLSLCLVYAQETAFKNTPKIKSFNRGASGNEIQLEERLATLEVTNNISFAYQKKYIAGKVIPNKPFTNGDIESYLKEILEPLKLSFKKIESPPDVIFVISPIAESDVPESVADSMHDVREFPTPPSKYIRGKVMHEQGNTLSGVNVTIKHTAVGTITDRDGNFSLVIPSTGFDTLQFSYIGFGRKEVPVLQREVFYVSLSEQASELSEVVVTALGISRAQKSLGYAVNTLSGDQLVQSGNTNFGASMYGKAPGVRIRTAPGGATSAVSVQIRGINSLNYNTQPLYVIDGVMMRDSNEKGASGINNDDYYTDQRIRGNGILDINPQDIESLTILKGASATALYGSDAASGVIVITTKKGSNRNGIGIELNYNWTREEVAFTPRYQNTYGPGYDRKRNIALGTDEEGWVSVDEDGDGTTDAIRPLFGAYGQFGPKMDGREVYWWDGSKRHYAAQPNNYRDFFQKGFSSSLNLALTNQIGDLAYRLSYTKNDYQGIQVGGELKRHTFNLNTAWKINKRLQSDVVINYTRSHVHNRPLKINRLLSSYSGFFSRAEDMDMFFSKYKTSAGYKWVPFNHANRNPEEALKFTPRGYEVMDFLWQQLKNSEVETNNRIISSVTLTYDVLKNLQLRGRFGNDHTSTGIETKQYNEYLTVFNGSNSTGSYKLADGRYDILYTDALLTYSKAISPSIKATVNAGFQLRDERYQDESRGTRGGLVKENWFNLRNSFYSTLETEEKHSSVLKYAWLGIVNFNYKDYAYVEGTARRESSSTLPPGNNTYFYPSVNSGFVFSDLLTLPKAISYGKVRASFGAVGNAPPVYEANILFDMKNLQTLNGSVISVSPNGNLYGNNFIRPERKNEMEFGLEARLLKNKVGVDVTYYKNWISDQILRMDLPSSSGANRILTNIGKLESDGWEVALSATPLSNRFIWNTNVNFSTNRTRLVKLWPGIDQLVFRDFEGSAIRVVAEEGESIGNIYVHPLKRDDVGNAIINQEGLYIIDKTKYVKAGNLLPKITGGFMNTLLYKSISLDFTIDYSCGGKIISPPLKYATGAGMYETTLKFRDEKNGGLPYYIDSNGEYVLLPSHHTDVPPGTTVLHDGVVLEGVTEEGVRNTTIIDAATYYLETFSWGNNAWNEKAIFNNDYVKVREVVLAYSLPKKWAQKMHLQGLRVGLVGRNLCYIYRTLDNLDPESTIGSSWLNQGIDDGAGPATRSYGFSVNMQF